MQMNDYIKLINDKLDEFIPISYPNSIYKSMKYGTKVIFGLNSGNTSRQTATTDIMP